jgi:hypothetical protein
MTNTTTSSQLQAVANAANHDTYDIRLFRALQPKLQKFKHIQLCGSISSDNFSKLLVALSSARVERVDLLEVKVENAKSYLRNPKLCASGMFSKPLDHLEILTYTITTSPKDDSTNALLWTIYERAINLEQLAQTICRSARSRLLWKTSNSTGPSIQGVC